MWNSLFGLKENACNKHFCENKFYSSSELNKGLLAMKKKIISEGNPQFEKDERYKKLTQCKTNVAEIWDENKCTKMYPKMYPKPKVSKPKANATKKVSKLAEQEKAERNARREQEDWDYQNLSSDEWQKKQEKRHGEEKAKKKEKNKAKREEMDRVDKMDQKEEDEYYHNLFEKEKQDEKRREDEYKANQLKKEADKLKEKADKLEKEAKELEKKAKKSSPPPKSPTKPNARCPKGTQRNKKTGNCEAKGAKSAKMSSPPKMTSPPKMSSPPKSLGKTRCPNGTRKNKKTGKCEPK